MDFNTYIKKNHLVYNNTHYNEFIKDTRNLFTYLKNNNIILSQKEIDSYIMKCTKNKRNSIINLSDYTTGKNDVMEPINLLTEYYTLTKKQVKRILESNTCMKTLKWIDNLIKYGYVFDQNEFTSIFDISVNENILEYCHKLNLLNASMFNKYIRKYKRELNQTKIYDILNHYSIVIDSETIKILFLEYNMMHELDNLKKYGSVSNDILYNIIIDYFYSYKYRSDELIMVHNNLLKTINNETNANDFFRKLLFYTDNFRNINILRDLETIIKLLINKNIIPSKENIYFLLNIYSNSQDNLDSLYDIFFIKLDYKPDEQFCDLICKKKNEKLMKYLISKNLFLTTINSINYACITPSQYIIEQLINMKCVPTMECFKFLPSVLQPDIMDLLFIGGLPFSVDVLAECYKKSKHVFKDLHGLKCDDSMYYAFYNNFGYCESYPYFDNKCDKIILRNNFCDATVNELEQFINEKNILPDQFCYDISIFNNNRSAKLWLEETYGFKPTYLTLILSNDKVIRTEIVENYLKVKKFNDIPDYKKLYVQDN